MKNSLQKIYNKSRLKNLFFSKQNLAYKQWLKNGKSVPPLHLVKQYVIKKIQKKTNYGLLVETGTFYGDMIASQLPNFEKIISVELSEELFLKAKKRFKHEPKITLFQGDSSNVLKEIMKKIDQPAIFWLDGHYSAGETAKGEKECPVLEELSAILDAKKQNHVILIDDARLFIGENDYPTIQELEKYISATGVGFKLSVEEDMIKLYINKVD